jgi:hypothetical protein
MSEKHSITGGGFNARIADEHPTPSTAPSRSAESVSRPAAPPTEYARTNDHLRPSSAPVLGIDASKISAGVAAFLQQHDRKQAEANGIVDWRGDAARLNAAVSAGEIWASDAAAIFAALHPTISDADIRGAQ